MVEQRYRKPQVVGSNPTVGSRIKMENIRSTGESFESLKSRVADIFAAEGLSENLKNIIQKWHDEQYEKTDKRGGAIEDRVIFQMRYAELYIITKRYEFAFDILDSALDQAKQERLDELVHQIGPMIDSCYE